MPNQAQAVEAASNRGSKRSTLAYGQLYVDARMLFSSGIGRYMREILSRRPEGDARPVTVFCNSSEQLDWVREHVPSAKPVSSGAGIYSLGEQWQGARLPANVTYWVPHYNVPSFARCRLVATIHDLAPLALREAFGGLHRRLAAKFYFGFAARKAHHILTVSEFTKREVVSHGIAPAGRVTAIPNGVGPFWFEGPQRGEPRPTLLYVGNLKPHKNLERLVTAVESVRKTHGIELAIAGRIEGFRTGLSGGFLDRLRSTSWIRLLGELPDSELRRHYSESSALVFPSLYEGFGLPLLEALAAGCPLVCSRIPALEEIAGKPKAEGGLAEYFDPRNPNDIHLAICRHIETPPKEKLRVAGEGRNLASKYTWEKTAASTWRLLAEHSPS